MKEFEPEVIYEGKMKIVRYPYCGTIVCDDDVVWGELI